MTRLIFFEEKNAPKSTRGIGAMVARGSPSFSITVTSKPRLRVRVPCSSFLFFVATKHLHCSGKVCMVENDFQVVW